MADDKEPPIEWQEMTDRERRALLAVARNNIFWQDLWARASWLKNAGTIFLTIAAAYTLLGEAIAAWLKSFGVK